MSAWAEKRGPEGRDFSVRGVMEKEGGERGKSFLDRLGIWDGLADR
jgi:hypothetical protein